MSRFSPRRISVVLAGAALAASAVATAGTAHAAFRDPTMDLPRATSGTPGLGPHFPYVQVIPIGGVVPLKNSAIINKTKNGYLYRAGQQDSDLTVTQTNDGRLQFVDAGTQSWKWLPKMCQQIDVPQGVGATCAIQSRFSQSEPMLIEVWPRLGNDSIDTSALSGLFDVSVLGDAGDDVVHLGAGNNFVNGAQDDDTVYGGDGNDWIRTGIGNDYIDGGGGDDNLVGVDNNDTIYGGSGDDHIYGSGGNDDLFSGAGDDYVVCGDGSDTATVKSTDRAVQCENENFN